MSNQAESSKAPAQQTSSPKNPLKRQPRNATRRSKEQRDEIEREEAKRRAERLRYAQADERAAEASRKAQYGYGGPGEDSRGGRGRGGDPRGRGRVIHRAPRGGRGGFMGGGNPSPSARGRGAGVTASSQTSTARTQVKREARVKQDADDDQAMQLDSIPAVKSQTTTNTKQGKEVYEVDSDDDEAAGARVDIEKLMDHVDLVSSEDEDDDPVIVGSRSKTPAKDRALMRAHGMPPVRLPRQEHADRQLGVNTEASAATLQEVKRQVDSPDFERGMGTGQRKAKGKAKDVQYMGEKKLFRGVYEDDDDDKPFIKPDPDAPEQTGHEDKAKAKTPARARRKSSTRRAKSPPAQTEEERREREIQQHEAWAIRSELGPASAAQQVTATTNLPQGATPSEGQSTTQAEEEEHDQRANNVYLFQLPPVMPGLVDAAERSKKDRPSDSATNLSGLPDESKPVKIEDENNAAATTQNDQTRGGASSFAASLAPGCVGKLRVHRSGRTSLSWGGTSLQLGMGIDGRFLQSVVLVDLPEADEARDALPPEQRQQAGSAKSLGQIRGKFVVTPDWGELLR